METHLTHRDASGGLFIGTSMSLFALMNSAPAELLHPLTMQHFSHVGWACVHKNLAAATKKNASNYAGVGKHFTTSKPFFEEKPAFADNVGTSGANR